MYSERDMNEINARIRRSALALTPVLAVILGLYIYALAARVRWLAMVAGPLLFVVACYGFLAKLWPDLRYRRFLRDMESGLSREMRGTIVAISDAAELQDGATVLPVRLKLAEGEECAVGESVQSHRLAVEAGENAGDERIVYLNASKRDCLPGPGAAVKLLCYGRHIRAVETL